MSGMYSKTSRGATVYALVLTLATLILAAADKSTACAATGRVTRSFYKDADDFYHLYFHNGLKVTVYISATYNKNVYDCTLGPGAGRDFTLTKTTPSPARLKASYRIVE